jgi:hypothetical protein
MLIVCILSNETIKEYNEREYDQEPFLGLFVQGVASPLAGQMFFRASLFSAFGASKRWLGTNADGSTRALTDIDFFKAGFITGAVAAFFEGPIDFYKSQIQVQIIRAKSDPNYKGECFRPLCIFVHFVWA